MANWYRLYDSKFQLLYQDGDLTTTVNAIPSGLCPEKAAGDPAKVLIAALPAFDISANDFDLVECRLDRVGAAKRGAQLVGNA